MTERPGDATDLLAESRREERLSRRPGDAPKDEWLSVGEASARFNVTGSRVRSWIKCGDVVARGRYPVKISAASVLERFSVLIPVPERRDARQGVYFVESNGFIKVGVAVDVRARWVGDRTDNPHPITRLGYIPVRGSSGLANALEGEIHRLFAPCRHRGEWFRASAGLLQFIEDNAKPWPT